MGYHGLTIFMIGKISIYFNTKELCYLAKNSSLGNQNCSKFLQHTLNDDGSDKNINSKFRIHAT